MTDGMFLGSKNQGDGSVQMSLKIVNGGGIINFLIILNHSLRSTRNHSVQSPWDNSL